MAAPVALVTGAASGIGRALAAALAGRGWRVVLADIDPAVGDAAAAIDGTAIVADLADPAVPARLIEQAFVIDGRLDLVASNAGVGFSKRLLKADLDAPAVERLFAVNTLAAVRLAQAYVAGVEARGQRGRLLITGSENSLSVPAAVKGFGLGLYAASKHGVLILAEWLRDECAGGDKPLDVSVLLPGAVFTPLAGTGAARIEDVPAQFAMITPARCAEIALAGLDAGLFYIPTHAHLADDMAPRSAGIRDALAKLGLTG